MTNYGHYDVSPIREVFRFMRDKLTMPVSSNDGGLAESVYEYVGRSATDGYHTYKLIGVHEWMPPLHPTMRNRADRKGCIGADGLSDLEAEASLRRREWAHMTIVDGAPVYEESDE